MQTMHGFLKCHHFTDTITRSLYFSLSDELQTRFYFNLYYGYNFTLAYIYIYILHMLQTQVYFSL